MIRLVAVCVLLSGCVSGPPDMKDFDLSHEELRERLEQRKVKALRMGHL